PRHTLHGSRAHAHPDPQPPAAQPGLGCRARARRRRAVGRLRQRNSGGPRRGGRRQRAVRHPPDRCHQPCRAPAQAEMSPLFAAPHAATTAAPVGAGGLASVTLALLIVLAAIFAIAWVARRVRGIGNRVGNAIDILADVPLGPKERAVLIKVGAEQILIGVAPGRVSALHVLREPVEITKSATATTPTATSFSALLKRSLGK